jgi:SAM-dependent MidA family methyltransferase
MSLKDRLKAEIAVAGPMSIDRFMTACLHDPRDGYYATRPRLGEDGDFITAPLVSQMFGELIGVWAVETWRGLGRPARVLLVEAGPGDGTLMSDILRAARLDARFLAAIDVWLVETSAPLIELQRARLADASVAPAWAARFDELPNDAPLIFVANEFLDCLPARQFVRTPDGVAERAVGLDATGALSFGLVPLPGEPAPKDAPVGAVIEVSAAQRDFAEALAGRIARQGGAALLIDYGRDQPGCGDTLQALRRHRKVDPLAEPGDADLTVHADFPGVLRTAKAAGLATAILGQGEFLRRLGVVERAEALSRSRPERADVIARQLTRLIDDDQMGRLFKAACLYAAGDPPPPAFGEAA